MTAALSSSTLRDRSRVAANRDRSRGERADRIRGACRNTESTNWGGRKRRMEFGFDLLDVVVADDDRRMRRFVRTVLESLGVRRVREAADGARAYAAIVAAPPDLLVTDYQMEPVDGIRLIRQIRRSADEAVRYLPIVMVTACAEPSTLARAREAGVNAVLRKPVSLTDLAGGIATVCGNPVPFIRTRGYFGPDRRLRQMPVIARERRVGCRS